MSPITRTTAAALVAVISIGAASCSDDPKTSTSSPAAESKTATKNSEKSKTSEKSKPSKAETGATTKADPADTKTADSKTADSSATDAKTVVDIAASNPDFTILVAAVKKAGLAEALSDKDATLTVFAPTNEAFEAYLKENDLTQEQLLENPKLGDILKHHVLGTTVDSKAALAAATEKSAVDTLAGDKIQLALAGDKITVDNATVVKADLAANNGVVHVVDKVIIPK